MDFGFSEAQELLRTQARSFLQDRCPMSRVREIALEDDGFSREIWLEMARLGWLGLTLPEACGGVELSWIDLLVILEELGRSLHPSPFISTTLAATALMKHGSAAQKQRWLPAIADGSCIATLALLDEEDSYHATGVTLKAQVDGEGLVLSGRKPFVADSAAADVFIVAFRGEDNDAGLAVVARTQSGVSIEKCNNLDRTKPSGSLQLDGVRLAADAILDGSQPVNDSAVEGLLELGALAVSAESIGVCDAILEMTTGYAKERVQFGSPIGRYQGVKHPLADIYSDIECMKSLTYYAAWAEASRGDEFSLAVARAKAYCSTAINNAGVVGLQTHGAIGYTEEYDFQLFLKRSKWARGSYGNEDYHYERVATLVGL